MQRPVRIELVAERALAEKFLELALERLRAVAPAQEPETRQTERVRAVVEDLAAEFEIAPRHLVGAHPDRERGRDDRARARAADQIEVIAQQEIGPAMSLAQDLFDPLEKADGQRAANSSAVEGEDSFRA